MRGHTKRFQGWILSLVLATSGQAQGAAPLVAAPAFQACDENKENRPTESRLPSSTITPTADARAGSSAFPSATPTATALPRCGDGVLDVGEQCDAGEAGSDEDCPAGCHYGLAGMLIRGNSRSARANRYGVIAQWHLRGVALALDSYGLPSMDQECTDQDPRCDFDPLPGRCELEVRLCLNSRDSNLTHAPRRALDRIEVLAPRDEDAESRRNLFALREGLRPVIGAVDSCTEAIHIGLDRRERHLTRQRLVVRATSWTDRSRRQWSRLNLTCRQNPQDNSAQDLVVARNENLSSALLSR